MNLRLIHANGDRAIAGGSDGVQILDARTGAVLAKTTGAHSDVAFMGNQPCGLLITPGNPATIRLRTYTSDLSSGSDRVSPNPPAGGRIVSRAGRLYWQAGRIVRVFQGDAVLRTIDTGLNAVDVAAIADGFVVVAGQAVEAYSAAGQKLWSGTLPAAARFVVASDDYVVCWGALVRDGQTIVLPMTVLDADTGALVAEITQTGPNFAACAAVHGRYLYIGRPQYVQGEAPTGVIEVFDLADRGSHRQSVALAHPPLALAATEYGVIAVANEHVMTVSAVEPPALPEAGEQAAAVDPYDAFLAENELTPDEAMLFQLLWSIKRLGSISSYNAILSALRG